VSHDPNATLDASQVRPADRLDVGVEELLERLLACPAWLRRVAPGSWQEAAVALAKCVLLERDTELLSKAEDSHRRLVEARAVERQAEKDAHRAYGAVHGEVEADLPRAAGLFVRVP